MKPNIFAFKIFLLSGFLLNFMFPERAFAVSQIIDNFDDVRSSPFSFKDDKGTKFKISTPQEDPVRNRVISFQYDVAGGGWAGWGLALKGASAENYTHLTFFVRGQAGGEVFEIGLKDQANVEKKFSISRFTDVGTEWRRVRIPLKEFEGLNLANLDNLNLAFTDSSAKGAVFLDDFQFEVTDAPQEGRARSGTFANKTVVDGFEKANPSDVYLVYQGDDSSLKLNASRISKEGNYALELEYTLSTARPWGSWVSARWQSKEIALDWRGTLDIKAWIKGDGSGNIFRFSVIDGEGERWNYEDIEILKSTGWELIQIPISKLVLDPKSANGNGKLDLHQIKAYEIGVLSPGGSKTTTGVKTSVGKILVDELYLAGEQISSVWTVPPVVSEAAKVGALKVGNIDFNGQLFTEFLNAPEQKSTVNHFGKLISNAKVGNYSARIEFASESQEFGEAARFNVAQSTAGGSTATTQAPKVVLTSLQGFANNVLPYVTQITVGNVFVDYSPFTFSPVFGFKGLSAEGDYEALNYHMFVLKHKFDSFTIGSRAKIFWEGWRLTGITVYYRETAKVADAASVSGAAVKASSDIELQEVQNDWVYTLDVDKPLYEEKISVGGSLGYNRYTQRATANRANPFEPIFGHLLDPALQVDGNMARGRLAFSNLLIPGFKVNYEYRVVDTEFKPRYRQSPISFDDLDSDQRGHNVRFVQSWRGFLASLEYDDMERASNDIYFRHRMIWAVGYYGFDKMDVAFNQELRRETYQLTSNRTDVPYGKNERVTVSELYVRVQMNPRAAFFIRPKREDVIHPGTGLTFSNESLYGKLEFYATTNLKVLGEFRTTRYGVKDFEPKGFPFDDNFIRTSLEFNF